MSYIKQFTEKHAKKLIILSAGIMLIIGFINLIYITEIRVTSNDECLWEQKNVTADSEAVFFEFVKVNGVAWNAGIRNGDQLLEINKTPAVNTFLLQNTLDKFKLGQYAPYKIKKKNGEILDVKVQVKKLVSVPFLSSTLLGIIWLIIGFIVVMAKPDGYIQKLFYRIGIGFILYMTIILINSTVRSFPIPIIILIDIAWSVASCFLPFMIVRFFCLFPRPFSFIEKRLVKRLFFYVPLIIFILTYTYRVIYIYIPRNYDVKFYQHLTAGLGFMITIALAVSLVSLYINYFKLKDKADRKPLFVILASFTLGFASILYTAFVAPAISDTIFNSPDYYAPIILILVIPISFGYSIFRYQLMDVTVVIKNTIMYGAATLSIAAIYFLVIYILGQTISSIIGTQYQGMVAGVIFILFAVVFQSTKDKFQDFLTEKFYPEQFAYQRVLISFINDISTYVGLETILDSMKKTFVHALRLNRFGILIRDDAPNTNGHPGKLRFLLERSEGIKNNGMEIYSNGLRDYIEAKQKVNRIPVIDRDNFANVFPGYEDELKGEKIYTIIPMIVKSKIIGLLLFGLKHSGSQFAGKDLELLNAAAGQSAISIENARLYLSESEKLKIERDLDLARKIQESLLPKCIPSIMGLDICGQMIPAMQVGGDYYDLIQISDNEIFVVVGDVSGKGLSASLYMTKLQTMIQLACTPDKTPKQVLVDINKRMYESIERSWFVTMTLALFDTSKHTVRFCRAGHMPILVSRNGKIDEYRSPGIGIGLERGIIFDRTLIEQEVKLLPGQIYTFYSDGITEAMNEKQELYGEENLAILLKNRTTQRSSQIMDEIWSTLTLHRGKAEQNDDMTMVIVKVNN